MGKSKQIKNSRATLLDDLTWNELPGILNLGVYIIYIYAIITILCQIRFALYELYIK